MINKFILVLTVLLIGLNANALPSGVSGRVCRATTRICVSNVTNPNTIKDEELLNACKQCCTVAPGIIGSQSCINRCQKKCEQAYKKVAPPSAE